MSAIMPTIFLHAPLKPTRRYDLGSTLQVAITNECGAERAARMVMPCRALGDLRNAAAVPVLADVSGYRGIGAAALIASSKYVNALHYIAASNPSILPSERVPNIEKFFWRDAFSSESAETPQYRIEAVSFVYNFAAFCCSLGISKARSSNLSAADFKTALEYFVDAAGVFEYMPRMPYLVSGGTIDLHAPTHNVLKFAMLGNAQQLYFLNAKITKRCSMRSLAKLASGARELYEITLRHISSNELRDTSVAGALLLPTQVLVHYYIAETALCDSSWNEDLVNSGDSNAVGLMVGHAKKAMQAIETALNLSRSLAPNSDYAREMNPALTTKYNECKSKVNHTEGLNNSVFYATVPENVDSSPHEVFANCSPMDHVFAGKHIDENLAPLGARNS